MKSGPIDLFTRQQTLSQRPIGLYRGGKDPLGGFYLTIHLTGSTLSAELRSM